MSTTLAEMTVGELVRERPARSRVFEKHGIDFCCGGKRQLAEACAKKGVSLDQVAQELTEADAVPEADDTLDFDAMPLDTLANHIVETHHNYLRMELPRLRAMSDKVAKVHGESDARLADLERVVDALADELESHMMKEERILFPVIRALAKSDGAVPMPFGTLANPISVMEHEHDSAGNCLERIHTLTDGHAPPDWACNTYRALLDGLRELELDLHQHIHKENNILFPKALELEAARG